jgi:hypothetical protein
MSSPPPSPPISPLTYNASEDDALFSSWSIADDHNSNNSNKNNDTLSNRQRIISQELDLAISELATPKAGHRNDGKTPKTSNKMSDSVNGVLAGQRNHREVPLDEEEGSRRFRIRPSDESVASLTSVWKRLYKMRAGGDSSRATDVDVGGDNEVKRNDTPGTSEEEDEASLRELEENDAFALEVGLML